METAASQLAACKQGNLRQASGMAEDAQSTVSPPMFKLRIVFDDGSRLGPGKADLLQFIERTGSIAAAGREMGMSYKRAWLLVDQLNHTFAGPLVVSERGGASGGGATLTQLGQDVLALYLAALARAETAASGELDSLNAMRGDIAERK